MLPLPRAVLVSLLTLSFNSYFGACVLAQDKAALLPNVMQAQADANPLEAQPIMQTSCDSCGGGLYGAQGYISHGSLGCSACGLGDCGGCGTCFPGQTCNHCVGGAPFVNFFFPLHNTICCPHPCYEPLWIASQNVAFFQDSARPVNQTRIRWDHGSNLIFPDRNNYMFAPSSNLSRLRGIRYDELRLSMEAGTERFTVTVDTPYRYWDGVGESKAGFSDIAIATKSLLIDSEILLMAFQFRTTIP
ncbi:MAG TPA: hypothetical protein PKD72_14480, partial [Gemmatales bacterium]|nr:hypothetical protein [Gemmatales bacterium]